MPETVPGQTVPGARFPAPPYTGGAPVKSSKIYFSKLFSPLVVTLPVFSGCLRPEATKYKMQETVLTTHKDMSPLSGQAKQVFQEFTRPAGWRFTGKISEALTGVFLQLSTSSLTA